MLQNLPKLAAWTVMFLGGLVLGLYLQPNPPEPQVIVQKVVEEGKKETVYVDRVVTKTIKPDGTVIERQHDRQQTTKQETVKQDEKPVAVLLKSKTKYSLDVHYEPSLTAPPSYRDVAIEAGFRLGESNAWVTSGYSVKHNQVTVGVRYEF